MQSDLPIESSILDGDLRVGDFVVRPLLKIVKPADVTDGSAEQRLPDKAMDVLLYLAGRAREVCTRDELLDAVWGEDREAHDRVLDNAIREIRRALDDDAKNPTYVQTIPKKGYRLLARVEVRESREFPVLPEPGEMPAREMALDGESPGEDPRPTAAPRQPTMPPSRTTDGAARDARRSAANVPWAAVLLSLAAAGLVVAFWFWPRDPSLRVELRISLPDDDVASDLSRSLRSALFDEHSCGDDDLIVPTSGLETSDFAVRVSTVGDRDSPRLEARLESALFPQSKIFGDYSGPDEPNASGVARFSQAVASAVDRRICELRGLPPEHQACHCLAASHSYHLLGDPAPHLKTLRRALELDPDLTEAYETLAIIYAELGVVSEALDVLESGLSRVGDPASIPALILRRRLAELLEDYGTERALIYELKRVVPDDPRWTLAEAAHLARHDQDCRRAFDLLTPVIERHPQVLMSPLETSASIWTCTLHTEGTEVRRGYSEAPVDAGTRFQLALGDMLVGKLERARGLANELLALAPDTADAYWLLGAIASRSGSYASARHWFERMEPLIRWPNEELRFRVGSSIVAMREGDRGLCSRFLDPPPVGGHGWNVYAQWALGHCQLLADQPSAARETLRSLRDRQIARNTLWDEWYLLNLEAAIESYGANGDPVRLLRAAKTYDPLLDLSPPNMGFFATEAGAAWLAAGDQEAGETWLLRALEFNPTYPWAHCRLGLLYDRQERDQAAEHHLTAALEVFGAEPEDPLGRVCADTLARRR